MKSSTLEPRAQLFVCTNARAAADPLQSGCGLAGPEVYEALRNAVAREGLLRSVWITRSGCQGLCPPRGCTVALWPAGRHVVSVEKGDAPALLGLATRGGKGEIP